METVTVNWEGEGVYVFTVRGTYTDAKTRVVYGDWTKVANNWQELEQYANHFAYGKQQVFARTKRALN